MDVNYQLLNSGERDEDSRSEIVSPDTDIDRNVHDTLSNTITIWKK